MSAAAAALPAAVHESDRGHFEVFLEEARMASWPERLRWDPDEDFEDWLGVRLDGDGRVCRIELQYTDEERG